MKHYKKHFIKYLSNIKNLGEGSISSYCSNISSYLDRTIRQIDPTHNSIFYTIDRELLELYFNELKENPKFNNSKIHRNSLSALKAYLKFCLYCENTDFEIDTKINPTENLILPHKEAQTDKDASYEKEFREFARLSLEETTVNQVTPVTTDKNISIEDIEKEIATFTKYNQPIPGELIKAKEVAISFEKKKKQRLLKNNIEYSLNNILSQIPLSMEYNISYTKENGFIIDFI